MGFQRLFVDHILHRGVLAIGFAAALPMKIASPFQLLDTFADGVNALYADVGKPTQGILPIVGQRTDDTEQTFRFQRQVGIAEGDVADDGE